jgi:hypothetical protein
MEEGEAGELTPSRADQLTAELVTGLIEHNVEGQRRADAAMVRAAGCICRELWQASAAWPEAFHFYGALRDPLLVMHDTRCPRALADAIEGRRP